MLLDLGRRLSVVLSCQGTDDGVHEIDVAVQERQPHRSVTPFRSVSPFRTFFFHRGSFVHSWFYLGCDGLCLQPFFSTAIGFGRAMLPSRSSDASVQSGNQCLQPFRFKTQLKFQIPGI